MNHAVNHAVVRMPFYSALVATGSYLPARCLHNDDLPVHLETNDEWIASRTGIRQRFLAAEGECTSDMAAMALTQALGRAGWTADSLDVIIVATTTPDCSFPATAVRVQRLVGAHAAVAFDMQAVCAGLVVALQTANGMLLQGTARRVAVIGAEVMSRLLDWNDRGTAILFGDGAGALLLESCEHAPPLLEAPSNDVLCGMLGSHWQSDGMLEGLLHTTGGVGSTQTSGTILMQGREVFRHAVEKMSSSLGIACARAGLEPQALDLIVPHQANRRIIDAIVKWASLPEDRVIITVDRHANTSAASIALALDDAWKSGRLKPWQTVGLTALGAGLVWGSIVWRLDGSLVTNPGIVASEGTGGMA